MKVVDQMLYTRLERIQNDFVSTISHWCPWWNLVTKIYRLNFPKIKIHTLHLHRGKFEIGQNHLQIIVCLYRPFKFVSTSK